MYVGRIVVVGRSESRCWVGYRVSSRSFPNRRASVRGESILVSPVDPRDLERNPYIAYNCIRLVSDTAVVANGTQADMIAEKIEDGMKPLDAISLSLVAYGYERDELDTPRLAGVVRGDEGWLGIAQRDEVRVKRFSLGEDSAFLVATYEKTEFEPVEMAGANAELVARAAFDLDLEKPVCSAAAFWTGEVFELGIYNPE
jgi:IMP cyclohydrolase